MDEILRSAKTHLALKFLFAGISIAMIYLTISTSIESNLFKEWNALGSIPWMRATLCDFYFNITILSCWVLYKEKKPVVSISWIIAFILLGSIATSFYVWAELMRLKPGQPVQTILLRRAE